MRRRVFVSMTAVAILTAIITAGLLWAVFGLTFSNNIADNLRNVRVTFVGADGAVTFDNKYDTAALDDHAERPEVLQAAQSGAGEYSRYSETERETSYYYAERLPDKSVLRLALTSNGAGRLLRGFVPSAAVCVLFALVVAYVAARWLTKRVVQPISDMPLDGLGEPVYAELIPYSKKIREQNDEISAKNAEIERSYDDMAYITENMREGLLLIDGKGKVLLANNRAAALLEARAGVGRQAGELCREAAFMDGVKNGLDGIEGEARLERGGRVYSALFAPTPPEGVLVLFVDVTDKSSAEKQRREFTANVSHELKTPLTTILGWAEVLAGGGVNEEGVRSSAVKIHASAAGLLSVVEDVIKLSEFDEGSADKRFTSFDLAEAAQCAAREPGEKARRLGVSLRVSAPETPVFANRRMIEELIYNLADNAVKYNKEGGSVDITVRRAGGRAEITVADDGVGIGEEHLPHVFERFYRADKSRSKAMGGTGLGLAIAKRIAEHHGGRIEISSKRGEGCVVKCEFAAASPQMRDLQDKGDKI